MSETENVWWVGRCGAPERSLCFRGTVPEFTADEQLELWCRPLESGAEIPDGNLPRIIANQIKLTRGETPSNPRLPAYFKHDLMFLSHAAIEVFRAHDLGEAQISPVEAQECGGAPIDEPVAVLFPRNPRRFMVKEASDFGNLPEVLRRKDRIRAKQDYGGDAIAVGREALTPPADIWVDPGFFDTFFMTDRLACALRGAGIAGDFDLRRARIVG